MLCIPIPGPNITAIKKQVAKAAAADLLELRVDLWDEPYEVVVDKPFIVTVRNKAHSGAFVDSEEERVALICQFLKFGAAFCDIEWDIDPKLLAKVEGALGEAKLIASHHGTGAVNADLLEVMRQACSNAALYKIVQGPVGTVASFNMLSLSHGNDDVIGITLGADGKPARLASAFLEAPISYASLEDSLATAAGQPRVDELFSRKGDKLFGLIGDPVDKSISDIFHNECFEDKGALYLKMRIEKSEAADFIQASRDLPFCGFSVTMPLKEAICGSLDEVVDTAAIVGAVNTVTVKDGRYIGSNTDGLGAVRAIESRYPISWGEAKVFVVGAGGTAKAIACEVRARGAKVTIFNRTLERGQAAAALVGCQALPLEELSLDYDVIINATSVGMKEDVSPVPQSCLKEGAIVLDVVNSSTTKLLREAKEAGCRIVSGRDMFVEQAKLQQEAWSEVAR